jgi:hypothetical protein
MRLPSIHISDRSKVIELGGLEIEKDNKFTPKKKKN